MRTLIEDEAQDVNEGVEAVSAKYQQIHAEASRKGRKRRPGLSFNCNLPYSVHQEFQALTQQLQALVGKEEKSDCTMTNFVVAAIQASIIPAQKRRLAELRGQANLYEAA